MEKKVGEQDVTSKNRKTSVKYLRAVLGEYSPIRQADVLTASENKPRGV